MCAKAEPEPESGITGKGDRRREKVWLSDAEKCCQVDERGREGQREGRHSTDGHLNYTVHLTLTNRVGQTALVSHFKAWLKAVQRYQRVPYIFGGKSTHYCAFQSPSSRPAKKPILEQYI